MNLSPRKRLLICFCLLTISVALIAPRPAYASPGIWEWIQKGLRIAAIVRGENPDEGRWDMDLWTTGAGIAALDIGYRAIVGCSHDDYLYCAQNNFPDPNPGSDEDQCDPCRPAEPGSASAFMPGGAFGYTSLAIKGISTINPPFSLTLYANNIRRNTIIGGQTYAQGDIGTYWRDIFEEATFAFWKKTRNLAYLLFVIVLIAMGFMVMLRYQVSPRTTVTVASALPKIAIGLVLITFSYPIVSLAVDLIRVLSLTAENLLVGVWEDVFGASSAYISGGVLDAFAIHVTILKNIANLAQRINLFSVIFLLVTLIALLVTVALALFEFIKRFVGLVYMGIFGPLIIAWGTLPGQEEAISGWFKNILVNVLALPAITLYMGAGLIILTANPSSPDKLPTFFAFAADLIAQAMTYFIGISILWNAHKVPSFLEAALTGSGNRR